MGFHELLFGLDDDFMVLADRAGGVTDEVPELIATVTALEAELGGRLEPSYRAFLAELGCAAALAKESAWPRPAAYEVRPRWQLEWGLELYGVSARVPPPLDVRVRLAEARRRGRDGVPVLGVLGVDLQLFLMGEGRYRWVDGRGAVEDLGAVSFEAVVAERVARLQADKDRYVAERAAPAEPRAPDGADEADEADEAEARGGVGVIVQEMIESPWEAEDILANFDGPTRRAVLANLLERAADDAALDEDLVEVVGAFAEPEVGEQLVAWVGHERAPVVRKAIESLARLEVPRLVDVLVAQFDRIAGLRDDLTCVAFIEALWDRRASDARVVPLVASWWRWSIDHDKTLMTSNAVFDRLVDQVADSELARGIFAQAAADPHPYLALRGKAGLVASGAPLASHLPAFLAGLAHETPSVQAQAEAALARFGRGAAGAEVREALALVLDGASGVAREAAARVLARLG